ncbi:MAG: hypothetical protein KDK78_09555, partial [Chlamydiia bacterium]|nr:hypothetical protein [Chlamydiia bacterium]
MTLLRWLFYYIGSIYFAVTLIGVSALYVALGTFLESSSDSHAYAAQLSYGHPLFQLLLWGYFVNILTSALRRWPFRKSHAPFLLTHLGLLMLLGGTIFKSYYGVQGTMAVMEGSGSQSIFLPGSESLHVETRDGTQQFPLTKHPLRGYDAVLAADSPKITLLDYKPHGRESFQLWFKPHWAEIKGLPNLPIQEWQPDHRLIPSFKARFFEDSNKDVAIYAVDAPSVAAVLEHWFCNRGTVLRQDASDGTTVEQRPPSASEFELPRSPLVQTTCKGFQPTSELCSLQVEPSIFLIRDAMGAQTVCAVSCDGALSYRAYRSDTIPPLYVLDKGYQGYAVLAELEIALD